MKVTACNMCRDNKFINPCSEEQSDGSVIISCPECGALLDRWIPGEDFDAKIEVVKK